MAETLPCQLETTPTNDDDPFQALQVSLQRWPLFHHINSPLMAPPEHHAQQRATPLVCVACGDTQLSSNATTPHLTLRCACAFCSPCLTTLFTRALSDESLYPPSCHQQHISLSLARPHLPSSLIRTYNQKRLELTTKNKIYCANVARGCNAFIARHSVHNGKAYCQKCGGVTCVRCKEMEHWGPCVEGEGTLLGVVEMGRKERWRGCPGCGRLVEKVDGCDHVLCRCGTDFCYACGLHLDECVCVEEQEDEDEENRALMERMWIARRQVERRPRTPVIREVEEDIIEDMMVAPFELAEDEFTDR